MTNHENETPPAYVRYWYLLDWVAAAVLTTVYLKAVGELVHRVWPDIPLAIDYILFLFVGIISLFVFRFAWHWTLGTVSLLVVSVIMETRKAMKEREEQDDEE